MRLEMVPETNHFVQSDPQMIKNPRLALDDSPEKLSSITLQLTFSGIAQNEV